MLAVTLLTAGAGFLMLGTRQSPRIYWFDGNLVLNASEVLEEADRFFLRTASREDAALVEGSRCHFSQTRPDADIQPELRCGPVLHFGGSVERPWDHLALRGRLSTGGIDLERTGSIKVGQALLKGEVLSRPDRARPGKTSDLEQPQPPRLAPGEISVAGDTQGVNLRRADAAIVGPADLDVRLEQLGSASEIRLRIGPRRPARDEELLIASLDVRSAEGAAIEVVAGPRRASLPEDARRGRRTIVVSVPIGVESRLELTLRGITQGFSLRSGQRIGPAVPVLDERPRSVLNQIIEAEQQLPGPVPALANVARLRFTVVEAELLVHSEWLGTAPPGSAWLALELRGFGAPFLFGASAVRIDLPASFVAVLPDATPVPATDLGMPPAGRTIYFPVAEAYRSGLVRITPTFDVEGSSGPDRVVFPPTDIAIELQPTQEPAERQRRH